MILTEQMLLIVWDRSQTTLRRFCLFLTTYPLALTFSMVWMLTKSGHFWTTYLPRLVNVVYEWPLWLNALHVSSYLTFFLQSNLIYLACPNVRKRQNPEPNFCTFAFLLSRHGNIPSCIHTYMWCYLGNSNHDTTQPAWNSIWNLTWFRINLPARL